MSRNVDLTVVDDDAIIWENIGKIDTFIIEEGIVFIFFHVVIKTVTSDLNIEISILSDANYYLFQNLTIVVSHANENSSTVFEIKN